MLWRGKADKIVWRRLANCISRKSRLKIEPHWSSLNCWFLHLSSNFVTCSKDFFVSPIFFRHLLTLSQLSVKNLGLIFSHLAHCRSIPSIPDHSRVHHFLQHTSVSCVLSTLYLHFISWSFNKFVGMGWWRDEWTYGWMDGGIDGWLNMDGWVDDETYGKIERCFTCKVCLQAAMSWGRKILEIFFS